MNWQTKISHITEKEMTIRGYDIDDIVENLDFAQTIFLTLTGRIPNKEETIIFNKVLAATVDHGGTPSTNATRTVASTKGELNVAVSAGLLAMNELHGGAVEGTMKFLLDTNNTEKKVKEYIESKKIIPGFGHRVHKEYDPRTKALVKKIKELKIKSDYVDKALEIEKLIEKIKGKRLVLNIDGIIGAILCDLKLPTNIANGIFMIARVPGLVAQAVEQKEDKNIMRVNEEDIEYIGEKNKKIN